MSITCLPCIIAGIYPIVGWKIKDEIVYTAEGASNDTGTIIKWAQAIGMKILIHFC